VLGKCSLQVLDISGNSIGDYGITAIARVLNDSCISDLHIMLCDITHHGIRVLTVVGALDSLRILDVSHNNIGDLGIVAISAVLMNSQICELYVKKCDMTASGAAALSAGLTLNKSIRKLSMSSNEVGDDGIERITMSLAHNQITELYVRECGITYAGVRMLANVLQFKNSIRKLDLQGNPIDVRGAQLLQLAMDNRDHLEPSYYDQMDKEWINIAKKWINIAKKWIIKVQQGNQVRSCVM